MSNVILEPACESADRSRNGRDPIGRQSNALGESVRQFGPGLVGILHVPPAGVGTRAAVVLMNAGLVHRIGPFRGYVLLARALAAHGFAVLRFDQGGLGDSAASTRGSTERRRVEIDAAIEMLRSETDTDRFIVGGICSGADDAFLLAGLDPRISGVLLLDGLAYRTPGFWLRHLVRKLRAPHAWRTLQRHHWLPGLDLYREHPARTAAVQQLQRLVERDVRILFVFTSGSSHYFNHYRQLRAGLGNAAAAAQVTLEHWPDCDHTFFLHCDRQRLQQRVLAWAQSEFPRINAAPIPVARPAP